MRRLPLVASCGGDSLIPDCPAGRVATLTREAIENLPLDIFVGTNFSDVRRAAALELFARYYPEEYHVWEQSLCDGLTFDPDHFLASPIFMVEEVDLGEPVAVLVASHSTPPPPAAPGRGGGRACWRHPRTECVPCG